MVSFISQIFVLVFGVTIVALAGWGIFVPDKIMTLVKRTIDQPSGIYIAVLVRLVLGVALIGVAPASLFPIAFQALGWIFIVAAIALAVAGRERVREFVFWWSERFSASINRMLLLFGIAFGAFLVYAVL